MKAFIALSFAAQALIASSLVVPDSSRLIARSLDNIPSKNVRRACDAGFTDVEGICYEYPETAIYARIRRFRHTDSNNPSKALGTVAATSEYDCFVIKGRLEYDFLTGACGGVPTTPGTIDTTLFQSSNKWTAALRGTCKQLFTDVDAERMGCQNVAYVSAATGCVALSTNNGVCYAPSCPRIGGGSNGGGTGQLYNLNGNCVAPELCVSTTWPNPVTSAGPTCSLCTQNARTCTSLNLPLTCKATYFFSDNACVKTCPPGTFKDTTLELDPKCSPCTGEGVATCSSNTVALTCKTDEPWTLYESKCYKTFARLKRYRHSVSSSYQSPANNPLRTVKSPSEYDCFITKGRTEYDFVGGDCGGPVVGDAGGIVPSNKWAIAIRGTCESVITDTTLRANTNCQDVIFLESDCRALTSNNNVCFPIRCDNTSPATFMQANTCVAPETCVSGTWPNPIASAGPTCSTCGGNARTCTAENIPLTCKATYFFSDNTCVKTCPPGTFKDTTLELDPKCSPCTGEGVATCSSNTVALTCKTDERYFLYAPETKCYKTYARIKRYRTKIGSEIKTVTASSELQCFTELNRLEYDIKSKACGGPDRDTYITPATTSELVASNKWALALGSTCTTLFTSKQITSMSCQDAIFVPLVGCYAIAEGDHVCKAV